MQVHFEIIDALLPLDLRLIFAIASKKAATSNIARTSTTAFKFKSDNDTVRTSLQPALFQFN
jgi:hypothetical protein